MSLKIKLVVADCDGTILDEQKKIDSNLKKTIKQLEEKGVLFTLASGRNVFLMKDIIDELELKIPVIVNNGATIIENGNRIKEFSLLRKYNNEICKQLVNHKLAFLVYSDKALYYYSSHEHLEVFKNKLKNKIDHIEYNEETNIDDAEIVKITIATNDVREIQDVKKIIEQKCPMISFKRSEGTLFTITNLQATKGNAVLSVAKMLGCDRDEIMCFGDNYNDISMFEMAKIKVAMANSDDEIKEKSTHQTLDNNSHGVSEFLKNYFNVE